MKHHHKKVILDKKWIVILVIVISVLLFLFYKHPQSFKDNTPDIVNPEGVRGPPNFHPLTENQTLSSGIQPTGGT